MRFKFLKSAACGLAALFAMSAGGIADDGPPGSNSAPQSVPGATTMDSLDAYLSRTDKLETPESWTDSLASDSQKPVNARLVCVFDNSGSVNDTEYEIVRDSMAEAISSEEFLYGLCYTGGPQSIAICVVEFDSGARLRIGWVDIRVDVQPTDSDEEIAKKRKEAGDRLKELAAKIRGMKRSNSGDTAQIRGLQMAGLCLQHCPWGDEKGDYVVPVVNKLNMVTDGEENDVTGNQEQALKDYVATIARDFHATVNALMTEVPEYKDLNEYLAKFMATPSGFVETDGHGHVVPVEAGFVATVATRDQTKDEVSLYRRRMLAAFRQSIFAPYVYYTAKPEFFVFKDLREHTLLARADVAAQKPELACP
jgi:hypothetical protein